MFREMTNFGFQVAQVASMLEIDVSVARDALEKVGWDVDGAPKSASQRSTVIVLRVFLAPAKAYGACLAPRQAAQAGARFTLPGSSFEPNGGAPRCAMHRRGVFLSRVFCSSGEAPWARQDYARCVWDGGVGPRMGLGREREKDGTTGRGSSLRILPPVGRPQFAPPIWGGRELRLPPHALGAGSGLEGSCPKSQGAAPKLRDSLGAALGVPCRTTSQRAVPDKTIEAKKDLTGLFCEPPRLLRNPINRAISH